MPASDDGHVGQAVGGLECLHHGQDGFGFGFVALERADLEREPARIGQQTDGDLWFQAAFLAEPGFTEPVTLVGFEVEVVTSYNKTVAGPNPTCVAQAPDSFARHSGLA